MLQIIRKKLFWSLDSLKGGNLRSHYNDIDFILRNLDSVESKSRRAQSLEELLKHAVNSTPFYKDFSNYKGLEDFMVIDKNVIRDYYDDFKSSTFKDQKNYSAYTSGSTGTPFKLLHDKNKRDRNSADVIYFAQKAGFEVGHKLYYIRHWDQYNSSKPWITRLKNIYMHPVSKLSKPDVENLLQKMSEDVSTKGIICYASVLDEMKNYLEGTDTAPVVKDVKSIIAISEALKDDSKSTMSKYFGAPVISRYSNVENGILAQQDVNSGEFHINWASYIVEILDMDTNVPTKPGTLGRIVITDLYNYCMPMIRYDTGDIGQLAVSVKNGETHMVLDSIEGRKMDMILNTSGKLMSPFTVYHILKYPHIAQYQFIQETKTQYTIKLNVLPEFHSAENIVTEFKNHLGNDAEIRLEYVEDIPLLSSGKRKFVVNKLKENIPKERI
ncbi:MAG: CoF synthetase [Gelidibacter sp.]